MDRYVIMMDSKLHTYYNYNDIPQEFDHLIEFAPEYPEPPHTEEQHEWLETLNDKLKELMSRERKNASSN
jgi:hypothetical protein